MFKGSNLIIILRQMTLAHYMKHPNLLLILKLGPKLISLLL